MTNSMIPYSFVPGTKAKADEVNANFISLANFIEQNKNVNTNLNPKWAFLVIETYFTFTFRKSKINIIFAK